jgi:hypothetical protein
MRCSDRRRPAPADDLACRTPSPNGASQAARAFHEIVLVGMPIVAATWRDGSGYEGHFMLFPPFLRVSDIRYREAPRLTTPGGGGGVGARSGRGGDPY